MKYISTRSQESATPSEAILKGIASDGGLFVPTYFPEIDLPSLVHKSYQDISYEVMRLYFDEFTRKELISYIQQAYEKFESPEVTPMVSFNSTHLLELFHGPTLAFKDVALSVLPYLMTASARIQEIQEDIMILTATSGDTGKAALEGFSGVEGTSVIVFYPENGVSIIQKKQMSTQKGNNVHVVAIDGNFDDAQQGVKALFNDKNFNLEMHKKNRVLSSANSINIGRLVPQIVYYFASYCQAIQKDQLSLGDPINFVVPTGNFGNILAGYYAKQMGLPIHKLICASNQNNVLYDFFTTGIYNKNRPFIQTSSPSMDILISSNLERLLFHVSQGDSAFINQAMKALSEMGSYQVSEPISVSLKSDFYGGYSDEEDTKATIRSIYEQYGYVLDPHTAVAVKVYEDYVRETGDKTYSVILSTASPFKFTKSVYEAIFGASTKDDITLIEELANKTGLEVPGDLIKMCQSDDIHTLVCAKDDMKHCVEKLLS